MKLTIGTRGSALALWQARYVASTIEKAHSNISVELMTIKTQGDKILDTPLAQIGSKGLFTKEIEEALLDGKVDLAVHSMKDLPTELPTGLKLSAIMEREDPRDVFISKDGRGLEELEVGARIGTSSLRRKAFLLNRLPHLQVISIRGNVDTRLKKMATENLAGVMLAAAGILRMGFGGRVTTFLEPDSMIPAIGQGALAIETRADDPRTADVVALLNHAETAQCVQVERAFLRRMGGGCQVPMAAHCVTDGDRLKVAAGVVHPDGTPFIREALTGPWGDASTGSKLADILIERGADTILRSVLDQDWEPGPTTDII
ncbi:MAG: hydroxymethylbilane synthase [Desulfomonilaceae bacterium]